MLTLQETIHLKTKYYSRCKAPHCRWRGRNPACTDRARKRLRYKDADGELTDDGRALAQRFFQAISERNVEILNRAYSDLHHELQDILAEGRAGDANVTDILIKATTLQDILIKSQKVARGEDDEFAQEFLSHLTKML